MNIIYTFFEVSCSNGLCVFEIVLTSSMLVNKIVYLLTVVILYFYGSFFVNVSDFLIFPTLIQINNHPYNLNKEWYYKCNQ